MRLSHLQRLVAAVLLMAYSITGTSLMPALMAVAAWVDGSHSVMVAQSENGTRVMLHHSMATGYTPSVQDHTSPLARIIVSLCSSSEGGDHQMVASQFESGARSDREDAARAAKEVPTVNADATRQRLVSMELVSRRTLRTSLPPAPSKVAQGAVLPLLASVQLMI